MALYTKSSQEKTKEKPSNTFKWGISLFVVSALCLFITISGFPKVLCNAIVGCIGLFACAFFSTTLAYSLPLLKNKVVKVKAKYAGYVLGAIFCVLAIIHALLTYEFASTATFAEYVKMCFTSKTAGGLFIGWLTFFIQKGLGIVGTCVIFLVILVVFVGLIVDYLLNNKDKSYIELKNSKFRKSIVENQNADEVELSGKVDDSAEKTDNGKVVSGANSVIDNAYLTPDGKLDKKKYILTPPSAEEIFHLQKRTDYKKPATNSDYNSNPYALPPRPTKNPFANSDVLKRGREFLKSTYPGLVKDEDEQKNPETESLENVENSGNNFVSEPEDFNNSIDSEETDIVNLKLSELKSNLNSNRETPISTGFNSSRASLLHASPIKSDDVGLSFDDFSKSNDNNNEQFGSEFNNKSNVFEEELDKTNIEPKANDNTNYFSSNFGAKNNNYSEKNNTYNNFNANGNLGGNDSSIPVQNTAPKPQKHPYVKPPLELLNTISSNYSDQDEECQQNVIILEQTLEDFRIPAKVLQVTKGPAVTRYEIQMPAGISVKKVQQHAEDIAMALSANGKIRIEAPIPGKNAVGIEVPNKKIATIALRDVLDSKSFQNSTSPLTFVLGKDIAGEPRVCDLRKLTHMLVAGSTGSGKSVCLNSLIISMMFKSSPEDLRFILIDPKRVEFSVYNGMPHLMLPEVITEADKAINALNWAIKEMERRYTVIQEARVKNLAEYNETPEVLSGDKPKIPIIVFVVDELADLMLANRREVEEKILKLAQKSRAAGIHLVLATQRPSVDVITGTIKGNLPSRIAFAVTSFADSKTILDGGGAERLLGRGDMLYSPQELPEPVRIQGAFISNSEVEAVVDFIKQNNSASFDDEANSHINTKNGSDEGGDDEDLDECFPDALRLVIELGQASTSLLQRRMALGYQRAARIIDKMEQLKFISPMDGSKPRTVYITMEEFERRFG